MRLTPARIALHASILVAWLAVCVSFFAFAYWVHDTYFLPFDKKPSIWLQNGRDSVAGTVFDFVNMIGDIQWIAAVMAAMFIALIVRGRLIEAAIVLGAGAMRYPQLLAREIVNRPFSWDYPPVPVKVFPTHDSFPSGHVFGEWMAYGLLFAFIPRIVPWAPIVWPVRLFCAFVLVAGGPARLYSGSHWLSDVIGSILLALMYLIPALWLDWVLRERETVGDDEERAFAAGILTPFRLRRAAADDGVRDWDR
jgi:undecaprenyl-diphosphatase